MKRKALAALLVLLSACSGAEKEAASSGAPANAQRVDQSTSSTLTGRVSFNGAAPRNPMVKLSGDPIGELLSVDPDAVNEQMPQIREHLDRFGDRLPTEIRTQFEALEERLS